MITWKTIKEDILEETDLPLCGCCDNTRWVIKQYYDLLQKYNNISNKKIRLPINMSMFVKSIKKIEEREINDG